jgi:hypothetical protein
MRITGDILKNFSLLTILSHFPRHNSAHLPVRSVITSIIHSYAARLLFVAAAIVAAIIIILFHIVFRDGRSLLRANR